MIARQFQLYQLETLDEEHIKMTTYKYWSKIGELTNGNAEPERGFSENKYILDDREQLNEETIIALRMIKNNINLYKDIEDFPVHNRRLLDLCYNARQKYFAYLDMKKEKEK